MISGRTGRGEGGWSQLIMSLFQYCECIGFWVWMLSLLLSCGTECLSSGANDIMWYQMLSSGANDIMWDQMLSSGVKQNLYVKLENGKLKNMYVRWDLTVLDPRCNSGLSSPILASLLSIPHPSPTLTQQDGTMRALTCLTSFFSIKRMSRLSSSSINHCLLCQSNYTV
jgi:hypothetical protein